MTITGSSVAKLRLTMDLMPVMFILRSTKLYAIEDVERSGRIDPGTLEECRHLGS
jgi:hypothetical protein